jgi:hypothetical protein
MLSAIPSTTPTTAGDARACRQKERDQRVNNFLCSYPQTFDEAEQYDLDTTFFCFHHFFT